MAIISLFEQHLPYAAFLTNRLDGHSAAPFDSFNLGLHVNDHMPTVLANRERVAYWVQQPNDNIVYMNQIHGNHVELVSEIPALPPVCDAMVTTTPNLTLMVLVADCVPIVLAAPGVVAVAHAGWRGTVANIVANTIAKMQQVSNVEKSDIKAIIGPSIGPCCYPVGPEVVEAVMASNLKDNDCLSVSNGQIFFDLQKANRLLVIKEGLCGENIQTIGDCTSCNNETYYSYRAEAGLTGRFGMGVALK
jgi:YfiH family protein